MACQYQWLASTAFSNPSSLSQTSCSTTHTLGCQVEITALITHPVCMTFPVLSLSVTWLCLPGLKIWKRSTNVFKRFSLLKVLSRCHIRRLWALSGWWWGELWEEKANSYMCVCKEIGNDAFWIMTFNWFTVCVSCNVPRMKTGHNPRDRVSFLLTSLLFESFFYCHSCQAQFFYSVSKEL